MLSAAPTQVTPDGCRILRGRWYDPYFGEFERDATSLNIHHVVHLGLGHRTATWSRPQRVRFANDPVIWFRFPPV